MKKLISIGVALALLTMAVVPGAVAAYEPPPTYAKVPFAIIQSGFELLDTILPDILGEFAPDLAWVTSLMIPIGEWAGGPLSWTVDMLAWGMVVAGDLMAIIEPLIGDALPIDLEQLFNTIACDLMMCWSTTNCTGDFDPCGLNITP